MTQIYGIEAQPLVVFSRGDKDPAVEIWEGIAEAAKKLGNLILQNQE